MKNKVLVMNVEDFSYSIADKINKELENGWLIELFYEARCINGNKIIVTLYKEEDDENTEDESYEKGSV